MWPPPASPLYVETSALLAWVFHEPRVADVRLAIEGAHAVATSSLTLLEAERAIVRGEALGRVLPAVAREMRSALEAAVANWSVVPISDDVLRAAKVRFPKEPVRSLDAIHLATAATLAGKAPGITILTLDDRVRGNAQALGIAVLP